MNNNEVIGNKTLSHKLRNIVWPIFGREHKKFLPMTLMISLILFDYTIFRNIKDTLVVSATGSSEIITFLKVWVVLPLAFLFFIVFSKLSNVFSKQSIFYGTIIFFLSFFGIFTYILYPNQDVIHPIKLSEWLGENTPHHFKHFINIIKYWSFSMFYAMSELWGSVVSSLLFWQFANGIVQVSEAKRFYAHFYLLANLATSFSGIVTKNVSSWGSEIADEVLRYGYSLNYLVLITIIGGILVMLLYYYMDKCVVTDPSLMPGDGSKPKKKSKLKLSIKESIKFILSSKYLGYIAILVISYGITINLVEVNWKHQIRMAFPDRSDYNGYMGIVSFYSGISTFLVILVGGSLVRWLGWRAGALATPFVIGVTGSIFFYLMIFNDSIAPLAAILGTTIVLLPVIIGTVQNILSKSTKYALFDPTKEMAYIPLDEESKAKGKAAVDVVGSRFGKAGGALMQQMMFIFIGHISLIAPYSASIMLIFVFIWIFAVCKLYKLFKEKGGEK